MNAIESEKTRGGERANADEETMDCERAIVYE